MKNFVIVLLFLGVGVYALYEQSKENPNRFLMYGCMLIFMYGLYRLMKKIPSKEEENEE